MGISYIKKKDQAISDYDNQRIKVNKLLLPFQKEKPCSIPKLNSWSYIQSEKGGLIHEPVQQGQSIFSYLLEGEMVFHNRAEDSWKSLQPGDLQLLKTRNEVILEQRLSEKTKLFHFSFDLNDSDTSSEDKIVEYYPHAEFPVTIGQGIKEKIIVGQPGHISWSFPGIEIKDIYLAYKVHHLNLDAGFTYFFYLVEGEFQVEDENIVQGDLFCVSHQNFLTVKPVIESRVIMISSPNDEGHD